MRKWMLTGVSVSDDIIIHNIKIQAKLSHTMQIPQW